MRQKWNNFMIFGASFVVSLSLMLIIVMLVLSFSIPTKQETVSGTKQDADLSLVGFVPTEKDRRNLLLICCQKQSDAPFGYCLVSFSPKDDTLWLIDLPAKAKLGEESLNDAYAVGSSEYAANAVREFFHIPLHGYLRVTAEGGEKVINAFGKVPVTFLEETTAGSYRFPAGEYRLNGKELWSLFADGNIASYLKPMLELALFADRYDEADALFHAVTGNSDTNILLKDYYDSKKAMRYFWFSEQRQIKTISFLTEEEREGWLSRVSWALHQ